MNTTEPTTAAYTLMCRLRQHVVTDEGDFVPAGTPVKVMGWVGNDSNGSGAAADAKVVVRVSAYMYADTFDFDTGQSATGAGLYIDVDPDNLVYDQMTEDFQRS